MLVSEKEAGGVESRWTEVSQDQDRERQKWVRPREQWPAAASALGHFCEQRQVRKSTLLMIGQRHPL